MPALARRHGHVAAAQAADAGLLLAAIVFGTYKGVMWLKVSRYTQITENAYVEADISIIAPKVQGYVREVLVGDNQVVRTGDILARIDDSDLRAKLIQAQAAVATRRAGIENVTANSARQQSSIAAARSEIDAKQAERRKVAQRLPVKVRLDTGFVGGGVHQLALAQTYRYFRHVAVDDYFHRLGCAVCTAIDDRQRTNCAAGTV
jgi:multidrug efflux pump subunit AcrA (membrane-fusion protein)